MEEQDGRNSMAVGYHANPWLCVKKYIPILIIKNEIFSFFYNDWT